VPKSGLRFVSLDAALGDQTASRRFTAFLLSLFAATALVITGAGLFPFEIPDTFQNGLQSMTGGPLVAVSSSVQDFQRAVPKRYWRRPREWFLKAEV
jgi:hypothetical protein